MEITYVFHLQQCCIISIIMVQFVLQLQHIHEFKLNKIVQVQKALRNKISLIINFVNIISVL
jgi:hypothetical protein